MNQKQWIFALLAVSVFLLPGCDKDKPAAEEIGYGTYENSVYKNEYFGLSIPISSEWHVQDQAAKKKVMDAASKVTEGNRNLKAAAKDALLRTVNLCTASQHPFGTPVESNSLFVCMAERVRDIPGIKKGTDYLFQLKKHLKASQMRVTFPSEITTLSIGGKTFDVLSVEMKGMGITLHQKHFVRIMKGYALAFAITYTNNTEESALQEILDGVSFE